MTLAAALAAGCGDESVIGPDETTPCGPELVCERATELCVVDQGIVITHRCASVPATCDGDRSCSCTGDPVCGDVACVDGEQDNEIACCPKCGTAATAATPEAGTSAAPGPEPAPPPAQPRHDTRPRHDSL